jgi:hypothetical protein
MERYIELPDGTEIRSPEYIRYVLNQARILAHNQNKNTEEFYSGVEHALRWVLTDTSIPPLPLNMEPDMVAGIGTI